MSIDRGNVGDVEITAQTDLGSVLTDLQFYTEDVLVAFALEVANLATTNTSLREIIAGIQEMIDD